MMDEKIRFRYRAGASRMSGKATILALLLVTSLCASGVFLVSNLKLSRQLHLRLQKPMAVAIRDSFPVTAAFAQEISVPLRTQIPVKLPVASVLRVPINETFEIGLNDTFYVQLDQPLRIDETIPVRCEVPLDTSVETSILGIKKKIPVKGLIPINIRVPLRQDIVLKGPLAVHMLDPLKVRIKKDVEAPINFTVEGKLPLNQRIRVPIAENLHCMIDMPKDLPLSMNLDFSLNDLGQSVRLGR